MEVPDEEGSELPNLEAARDYAFRQARSLIAELAKEQGRIVLTHSIDIKDEHGAVLDNVTFGDAVKIES